MRSVRVYFKNGDSIFTHINGTRESVSEYYAPGKWFNLGTGAAGKEDNMQQVDKIFVFGEFETGAETHAVNDLVLFADNTRELAEQKEAFFKACHEKNYLLLPYLEGFYNDARRQYKKEFPTSHDHIKGMTAAEKADFIHLQIAEFQEYKRKEERSK